jgi:hypothetical protein
MNCNVGLVDRITRGLVGIIIGSGGIMVQAPFLRWPMLIAGAILILTALFAFCPFYFSTGISTHREPTFPNT